MKSLFGLALAAISFAGVTQLRAETPYELGWRDGTTWACSYSKAESTSRLLTECWTLEGNSLSSETQKATVDCGGMTVTYDNVSPIDLKPFRDDPHDVPLFQRGEMALYLAACKDRPLAFTKSDPNGSDINDFYGNWLRLKEGANKIPRRCSLKNDDDVVRISRKTLDEYALGCDLTRWRKQGAGFEVTATCASEGETTKYTHYFVRFDNVLIRAGSHGVELFKKCGP